MTEEQINQLRALNFEQFLTFIKIETETLSFTPGSNTAYLEASQVISTIITRYVQEYDLTWENYSNTQDGNNLRLDKNILDRYKDSRSNKSKESVIMEFKKELIIDLRSMLSGLKTKNEEKQSNSSIDGME